MFRKICITVYIYTVNDRLNTLGVYLKIQNFKGVFIQEGHLIKRGVYFKMYKFRKQKRTFSQGPRSRGAKGAIAPPQ